MAGAGWRGTCLLSWLIWGRDHYRVADGKRNEEVEHVRQLRRQAGQRLLLVPRDGQAPVALTHLLQQLRVGRDVFLLEETRGWQVSLTPGPTKCLRGLLFKAP